MSEDKAGFLDKFKVKMKKMHEKGYFPLMLSSRDRNTELCHNVVNYDFYLPENAPRTFTKGPSPKTKRRNK